MTRYDMLFELINVVGGNTAHYMVRKYWDYCTYNPSDELCVAYGKALLDRLN